MVQFLTNSWKDYLLGRPGADEGNANMDAYGLAMKAGTDRKLKLAALLDDPDTVFVVVEKTSRILLLHSPKNFGGKFNRPKDKLVALIGFGVEAACIELEISKLLDDVNIIAPP